jgi:hypothetical protein
VERVGAEAGEDDAVAGLVGADDLEVGSELS